MTTHNTHNRQTYVPPLGFEPTVSAGEGLKTYTSDRAASGTGLLSANATLIGRILGMEQAVETEVCGRRVSDSWSLTVALNVQEGGRIVVAC